MAGFQQHVTNHFMRGNSLAGFRFAFLLISNCAQQANCVIMFALGIGQPCLRNRQLVGNVFILSSFLLLVRREFFLNTLKL